MEKETANATCPSTELNKGCCGPEPLGCVIYLLVAPLLYVLDISIYGPQAGFFNWFLMNAGGLILTVIFCIILVCVYYAIRFLITYIKTKINNKRGK